MTYRFEDKFDRADGEIGSNYTVACGGVIISDEAVIPIDAEEIVSGVSPILGTTVTAQKTQVFYSAESMDGPDYVVRGTFARDIEDPSAPSTGTAPSFTLLARMSKDPLLYDLGTAEEPNCYDQGYGARVTFPLDGSSPILKIIKFSPSLRLPGAARASSSEVDSAIVLASAVLNNEDLNLDPDQVEGEDPLYRGYWQDMRLRIARADREVKLDVFLNDRNLNTPKISHVDRQDPLWGAVGLPGFEFLSATLDAQPAGVSPFGLFGLSTLRCGIFSSETFREPRPPVTVSPGSFYTYQEVVNRVITLVERDGDSVYNATAAGQTKFQTYLKFVIEAESDLIRKEGYFDWLRRSSRIYLNPNQTIYELPEDLGVLEVIVPGSWTAGPLQGFDRWTFSQITRRNSLGAGRITAYTYEETGANSRKQIEFWPPPGDGNDGEEDVFVEVYYYARMLYPNEPDVQIPFVPQEHMDVLLYGAAAHAFLTDTDEGNAMRFVQVYQAKLKDLRRANNRKVGGEHTVMRHAANFVHPAAASLPVTRVSQFNSLLLFP